MPKVDSDVANSPRVSAVRGHVDNEVFKNVVGHFASGVTVLTTVDGGKFFGTTASAVSMLSMDPPMMLICLNRSSSTHDAIIRSRAYGINILAEGQGELARHFGQKRGDKFEGVSYDVSQEGVPLLHGSLATMVCSVAETAQGGTHTIFLGIVTEAHASTGEPLAYFRGTFGRLERTKELRAYDGTREWVLARRTVLGEPIDDDAIAEELRVDLSLIGSALIRLSAENLVMRAESGEFVVTPMTVKLVDSFYEARLIMEIGVLESNLGNVTDEQFSALEALRDDISAMILDTPDALNQFLDRNIEFHRRIIELAGSDQLTESFLRLNVGTVWRETFNAAEWGQQRDKGFLTTLLYAMRNGDKEGCKVALRAQTKYMKELAKTTIDLNGGEV